MQSEMSLFLERLEYYINFFSGTMGNKTEPEGIVVEDWASFLEIFHLNLMF